jgi:hypothetical protein
MTFHYANLAREERRVAFDNLRKILEQGKPATVELDAPPDSVDKVIAEISSSRVIMDTGDMLYDLLTGEEYTDPTFSAERWNSFAQRWGFSFAGDVTENLALKIDGNAMYDKVSRMPREDQDRIGMFLMAHVRRNFRLEDCQDLGAGKINLYVLPKYGDLDLDFDTSLLLSELMMILNPRMKADELNSISSITDETSSVMVGRANDRIFKIYTDEDVAWKEAAVLQMISNGDIAQHNVVKLSTGGFPLKVGLTYVFNDETDELEPLKPEERFVRMKVDDLIARMDIAPEEKGWISVSRQRGCVYFRGMYLLTTESEEPIDVRVESRDIKTTKRRSLADDEYTADGIEESHHMARLAFFSKLAEAASLDERLMEDDPIIDRLVTLALLHRRKDGFLKKLTHYHRDELKGDEREIREVQKLLDSCWRGGRHDAELKQEIAAAKERASFYREMLGKLERLIPEAYHDFLLVDIGQRAGRMLPEHVMQTYIDASQRQRRLFEQRQKEGTLVFTHGDAKWDNWFGDALGDFGSCKFSTEYKDVAKSLLDSAHIFNRGVVGDYLRLYLKARGLCNVRADLENTKESPDDEFIRGCHVRIGKGRVIEIPNYEWFKANYWNGIAATMRREGMRGVKERINSFRRNVYDAILTESVRTIYYKAPMHEKRQLVGKLAEIASHYAGMIQTERQDGIR